MMNKFTLIIPTHNRHKYLSRSIEYFKDLDAQVIYVDSSSIPFTGKVAQNMHYLHLPNKKFAEKILLALAETSNEIVALCADDDFILIESLSNGADFLSENNNFSTIVGKYFSFNEDFDGNYAKNLRILHDILYSTEKNAKVFFSDYYQILWAMYRKNILLSAFNVIKQAQFNNDNFIELIIGAVACYSGGIKFLNDIWGIREKSNSDHWGRQHLSISQMSKTDLKQDFMEIRILLDQCTSDGYSNIVLKSYLQFTRKKDISLVTAIKKIIPRQFIKSLSLIKQKLTKKRNLEIINHEELLKLSGISKVLENHNQQIK